MQGDEEIGIGGIGLLLGGLILACVVGVSSFAIYTTLPEAPAQVTGEPLPRGEPLAQIYFEVGSADLPEEAGGALLSILEKAQASPGSIVLISGFHDPSGDPEKNALLARQRAEAARQALIEAGLAAERIVLRKPELIPGTEDMQEARRVDLRVQ